MRAAIGCRARSGWATLVAVQMPEDDVHLPDLVLSRRINLTRHGGADEKQPYHAGADLPLDEARELIAVVTAEATSRAEQAVRDLVHELGDVDGFGIVLGSGKSFAPASYPPLEKILGAHTLLHAAEGEMFRDVMTRGAERAGLRIVGETERDLPAALAHAAGRTEAAVQQHVAVAGKHLGPPWTAQEKFAGLVAWLALLPQR